MGALSLSSNPSLAKSIFRHGWDGSTYRFFVDCLKAGEYEQAFDLYVAYLTKFGPLDNHTLPQHEIIDYYKLDQF
ncbi:MAG: hypothetical protein AAFX98_08880, partial [Pseudomonadota bacterium]